jgi:hypothetical protein
MVRVVADGVGVAPRLALRSRRMARHEAHITRELDSGDVSMTAVHVGDGYYEATYSCRVCGEEADREVRADRRIVLGKWKLWAREHWHNP